MDKSLTNHKYEYQKALCFALILALHLGMFSKRIQTQNLGSQVSKEKRQKVSINIKRVKRKDAKQIVSTVKSKEKIKPVKTKFLSKDENYFLRQTKAKRIGSFSAGSKGVEKAKDLVNKSSQKKSKKSKKKKVGFSMESLSKATQEMTKVDQSQFTKVKKGTKFGQAKQFGLSANNDFIEKLPLSDFSRINTDRSKFYSYFARIKASLEHTWGQSLQDKAMILYAKGSRLPASENLITDLEVSMNSIGEIISLKIKGLSGVKELDDAALEAFNRAGPFPNPPKGLVKNGKIDIQWGFVVKN